MISGRQALASIDTAMASERGKISELEERISALSAKAMEHQKQDAIDYRELARTRVDLLAGGELLSHIDEAEQQVVALLRKRDEADAELGRRIRDAERDIQALEAQRAAQLEQVDQAAERLDEADARVQQELDARPEYQAQRERTLEAERRARHAGDKAARSAEEEDQKGAAYRADPLFMYLWDRKYGLPEYGSGGLVRWLDGKVARLIGFADARANYARLSEIPVRLREHAEGLEREAESEHRSLEGLDARAREAAGMQDLERELGGLQEDLDGIDERIAAAEADHGDLLDRKAALASGTDEHTRQAVEYLAAELRREDLMELRREALQTPYPDDDLIVHRMLEREEETRSLTASSQGLKTTLDEHRHRLSELEALRRDFKRSRYDRVGSGFSDGTLVALMLNNFLDGMLDRRDLWKMLRQQHRYRPRQSDPRFGSGGFGRGTVWGGPDLGDLMDVAGRLGRGRGGFGGGGGGFRTGGGFGGGGGGGGGFRTGGGF